MNNGASSLFNAMLRIWSKIWDANVPPKVKILVANTSQIVIPTTRYIKMNIDGSWNNDRRVAGFGIMDAFSPFQAEVIAAREGLIWAVNKGFQKIQFVSDLLQIVEATRDSFINLSSVGQIVKDIKALLLKISKATFTHTH
ncbi:unnamed protein product [Malus baccata var. baccata]